MILVIRISGDVEIPLKVKEALFRLRIRRKYTATIIEDTKENQDLLQFLRNFIAFGKIDKETLSLLIEKRSIPIKKGKKIVPADVAEQIAKKGLAESDIKPYFRLHPPRGGIDTKFHFPIRKGVLGDNKEKINDLVRRML